MRYGALGPESRTAAGQTVDFGAHRFSTLEITITDVNTGRRERLFGGRSAVGFGEIRIVPDGSHTPITVDEIIDMPTDLVRAAAPSADRLPLVYLMSRDRQPEVPPRRSPEDALIRRFTVPNTRSFGLTGTARIDAQAPPAVIDSVLGADGSIATGATESLAACVHCRPWSAIDHDPSTAWQSPFVGTRGQAIEYDLRHPITVDHLDLQIVADGRHSVPTKLRLHVGDQVRDITVPPITDVTDKGENVTVTVPIDVAPATREGRSRSRWSTRVRC